MPYDAVLLSSTIGLRALRSASAGFILLCGACGSDDPAGPKQISVGGQYATAVTLENNSCPAITVQNNPTTVAHTAGATALTITHAGNSYTGTVQPSGSFSTTPKAVGTGEVHTLTIAGQFSTTGFDAIAAVDVQRTSAPLTCHYDVHWIGTKQGTPNTIP